MNKVMAGIDLHSNNAVIALVNGQGQRLGHKKVPCHIDAVEKFLQPHRQQLSGGDDAEIAGSDSELQSAIGNLVNNAVRYTPAGGTIQVSWQMRGDGSGELDVADTGPGIAREHLSRLTERFYRVDGSRARDTGGTGLGLAIVKHVIQRHSGELDIQSEVGKGSSFRLVFPAVRVRVVDGVGGTTQASEQTQGALP